MTPSSVAVLSFRKLFVFEQFEKFAYSMECNLVIKMSVATLNRSRSCKGPLPTM